MPLPEIIGSHFTSFPVRRASRKSTRNQPAVFNTLPSMNCTISFSHWPAYVRATRYNSTIRPAAAPVRSPSAIRITGSLCARFNVYPVSFFTLFPPPGPAFFLFCVFIYKYIPIFPQRKPVRIKNQYINIEKITVIIPQIPMARPLMAPSVSPSSTAFDVPTA